MKTNRSFYINALLSILLCAVFGPRLLAAADNTSRESQSKKSELNTHSSEFHLFVRLAVGFGGVRMENFTFYDNDDSFYFFFSEPVTNDPAEILIYENSGENWGVAFGILNSKRIGFGLFYEGGLSSNLALKKKENVSNTAAVRDTDSVHFGLVGPVFVMRLPFLQNRIRLVLKTGLALMNPKRLPIDNAKGLGGAIELEYDFLPDHLIHPGISLFYTFARTSYEEPGDFGIYTYGFRLQTYGLRLVLSYR